MHQPIEVVYENGVLRPLLPLGSHAVKALRRYYAIREQLVSSSREAGRSRRVDTRAVFLSARGQRLSARGVACTVSRRCFWYGFAARTTLSMR